MQQKVASDETTLRSRCGRLTCCLAAAICLAAGWAGQLAAVQQQRSESKTLWLVWSVGSLLTPFISYSCNAPCSTLRVP
jgi:hypothetical protein